MIDFTTKRVLTFDCYGTLIDWETGILSTLRPILADHGVTADAERLLALHAELESAAERGPYTPYRQLLMTVLRGVGDSVGDWPPFADTQPALKALERRFRLAIISNTDDDLFARTNQQLDVAFDWIVTAQQVKSYKPSLNNFRQALAHIGLPTEHVLHVAQSLFHDHVPAKQVGLETVWVNRRHGKAGSGATPMADARPDLEVPDLATLVTLSGAEK